MTADELDMSETPVVAYALQISAAELVGRGDSEGALILLREAPVEERHLARAGLAILAEVMSGTGAAARFAELRATTHQLAAEVGAKDRQVILNQETIGAAQALATGNLDLANAITAGSDFAPLDFAWGAACFTGQAVVGWMGAGRAPGFWAALRRQYDWVHPVFEFVCSGFRGRCRPPGGGCSCMPQRGRRLVAQGRMAVSVVVLVFEVADDHAGLRAGCASVCG